MLPVKKLQNKIFSTQNVSAEQIHASRKQINKNNNNKYGEESISVQGNKCHTPQQLMQHTYCT
jgi:DNA-binding XRE family transcriptional regulator